MSYIKGKVYYLKTLPFILWIKLVILNIIVEKSNLLTISYITNIKKIPKKCIFLGIFFYLSPKT